MTQARSLVEDASDWRLEARKLKDAGLTYTKISELTGKPRSTVRFALCEQVRLKNREACAKRPERLAAKARRAEKLATGEEGVAQKTIYTRKYNARHPEKRAAHKAVEFALRRGELFRLPCEMCGNPKSEAHHDDYSKPLSVVWLCAQHHRQVHRIPASLSSQCVGTRLSVDCGIRSRQPLFIGAEVK